MTLLDQALNAILASGPMAVVLGSAVVMLWRQNVAERERHAAEERALQDKLIEVLKQLASNAKGEH